MKLNAEVQNMVGRHDIGESAQYQQAFSPEAPTTTGARLRPREDNGSKTALSVRRGIVAIAEGFFAAVHNPASHTPNERST
jgi:hypothetical protein